MSPWRGEAQVSLKTTGAQKHAYKQKSIQKRKCKNILKMFENARNKGVREFNFFNQQRYVIPSVFNDLLSPQISMCL